MTKYGKLLDLFLGPKEQPTPLNVSVEQGPEKVLEERDRSQKIVAVQNILLDACGDIYEVGPNKAAAEAIHKLGLYLSQENLA